MRHLSSRGLWVFGVSELGEENKPLDAAGSFYKGNASGTSSTVLNQLVELGLSVWVTLHG